MTEIAASPDGTLERTPDGGVIRFERHLPYPVEAVPEGTVLRFDQRVASVDEAVEGCWMVGMYTSLARLEPALAGAPVPWDWDAFAAARAHYAELGLASPDPEAGR